MRINNKGITLMELLAYLSLVGIIVTLLTSTFSYTVKTYDLINGQGAVVAEANFIMSNLITQTNVINPAFVSSCGTNCVEITLAKELYIDPELGIIVDYDPNQEDKQENQSKKIHISDVNNGDIGNIYLGTMRLNNKSFGINSKDSSVSYVCFDEFVDNTCQQPVLLIRLAIVKVNKKGESISKHSFIFENRFTFKQRRVD